MFFPTLMLQYLYASGKTAITGQEFLVFIGRNGRRQTN